MQLQVTEHSPKTNRTQLKIMPIEGQYGTDNYYNGVE